MWSLRVLILIPVMLLSWFSVLPVQSGPGAASDIVRRKCECVLSFEGALLVRTWLCVTMTVWA